MREIFLSKDVDGSPRTTWNVPLFITSIALMTIIERRDRPPPYLPLSMAHHRVYGVLALHYPVWLSCEHKAKLLLLIKCTKSQK